ncbi:MAG: hypothetical protein EXQ85_06895 [Alphaproteobacteria bacterium]|nr:hypothetical protein [Alphaproteobacteria bacterium]
MSDWISVLKSWIYRIIELGLALIALGIVIQILFGGQVPAFFSNIIGNLTGLVKGLGDNGLVGLIALAIILYLFSDRAKKS